MGVSAVGVAAAAVAAANAILRGAEREAFDSGPDYMRDGTPDGVVGRIGLGIARQACRRYADDPGRLDDPEATSFETVCRPYLDNIGYGVGPELKKPFEGGQCDEAKYLVVASWVNDFTGVTQTFPSIINGPLGGVRIDNPDGASNRLEINCRGRASGSDCSVAAPALQPQGWFNVASSAGDRSAPAIASVTACGFEDNCGNPPPEIEPPEPPPVPGPPTEPFNPGPDVDIDITVEIKPDALVEVNLGFGPIIIAPFGGGGGDDGGGDPTDPTDPGSGAPGSPEAGPEVPGGNGGIGGDDAFGGDPAGRRWVGACIRITETPANTSVIVTSEPEDVYPSVIGNARLVYDAFGNRVVDTPVQIRAKGVCLWEPVRGMNPVAVNVDLLPGYSYAYTPYSLPVDN